MNYRTLALLKPAQPSQAEAPKFIDYTQPTYADLPYNPQNPVRLGRNLLGAHEGTLLAHTVELNVGRDGKSQETIVFTPAPRLTEPTYLFADGGKELHTMLLNIRQAAVLVCADRGLTASGGGNYSHPDGAKVVKMMQHTADIIDFWGANFPLWKWRKRQV